MKHRLRRLTTTYVMEEDRIRLCGAGANDVAVTVWVTQRLVQRLVPVLVAWIEERDRDVLRPEVMQSFVQQRAAQSLEPAKPVESEAAGETWLATAVDVHRTPTEVAIVFRDGENQASMGFTQMQLRQWLEILRKCHLVAEWPDGIWPAWMVTDSVPRPDGAVLLQ
jgi:hypothetical protein